MIRSLQKNTVFHYPFVFDVVRILLGALLFYKGIVFISSFEMMEEIVQGSRNEGMAFILVNHVAFTLIVGGLLIALGLLTRVAVLFQLLVFVGMLLNPNAEYGLYAVYQERIFAILFTLILVFYLFYGSGYYSIDHRLKKRKM